MGAPTWKNMDEVADFRELYDVGSLASIAIQSQYAASPTMVKLAGSFQDTMDTSSDLDTIYNCLFWLPTCTGVALDYWGDIVAIKRQLNTSSGQIVWDDETYRFLILYKAVANISASDAASINDLLTRLFGEGVFIYDKQNMTIRIITLFYADDQQKAILTNYGLLARGGGVGWEWLQVRPEETFGFTHSELQPFNQGVFLPYDIINEDYVFIPDPNLDPDPEPIPVGPDTWAFKVEAAVNDEGNFIVGVPFFANDSINANLKLNIDWGDGQAQTLTRADFPANGEAYDTSAATHVYVKGGKYIIQIQADNWEDTYIDMRTTSTLDVEKEPALYWFKNTLVSLYSPIPKFAGVRQTTNGTASTSKCDNAFNYLFAFTTKLESISADFFKYTGGSVSLYEYLFYNSSLPELPDGIFDLRTNIGRASGMLYNSKITALPANLFAQCKDLSYCTFMLYGLDLTSCHVDVLNGADDLRDISYLLSSRHDLRLTAANISNASNIMPYKNAEDNVTIYVPAGSTTATTLNKLASTYKLTIIEE